jgi:hypothetical protein
MASYAVPFENGYDALAVLYARSGGANRQRYKAPRLDFHCLLLQDDT